MKLLLNPYPVYCFLAWGKANINGANQAWARVKSELQQALRCSFSHCQRAAENFPATTFDVRLSGSISWYVTFSSWHTFLTTDEWNNGWQSEFKSLFFLPLAHHRSFFISASDVINSFLALPAFFIVTCWYSPQQLLCGHRQRAVAVSMASGGFLFLYICLLLRVLTFIWLCVAHFSVVLLIVDRIPRYHVYSITVGQVYLCSMFKGTVLVWVA